MSKAEETFKTSEEILGKVVDYKAIEADLQTKWYDSLDRGKPDFSVYEGEGYVHETYECWKVYSRRYIKLLAKLKFSGVNHVLDIGCGLGYSTVQLAELFDCKATGTNIKDSLQWQVCSAMRVLHGIELSEKYVPADLVFASEYFEHFSHPNLELEGMLDIVDPKYVVTANTFGSDSIGHFREYNGEARSKAGRSFGNVLRRRGYKKVETKFWNSRPSVWVKA
tara:strand:- start:8 stop:676 length:669 start_codon:yes stop_codon:yes gene_type:complete